MNCIQTQGGNRTLGTMEGQSEPLLTMTLAVGAGGRPVSLRLGQGSYPTLLCREPELASVCVSVCTRVCEGKGFSPPDTLAQTAREPPFCPWAAKACRNHTEFHFALRTESRQPHSLLSREFGRGSRVNCCRRPWKKTSVLCSSKKISNIINL